MASAKRLPLFSFPDDFEDDDDRELVKGDDEIYSDLDNPLLNDCCDPGGHVWLGDNGLTWCINGCGKRPPE